VERIAVTRKAQGSEKGSASRRMVCNIFNPPVV
jgi:hypothetical protein